MNFEFVEIEDKPINWPANAAELQLDQISISLNDFIKNPTYETKDELISLVSNYDLNQESHIGLWRTTDYEVSQINTLYFYANLYQISPIKTYLYNFIGAKTRIQKMSSWYKEANITVEIPEYHSLFPQLHLYYIIYQTYTIEKNKNLAGYLIEYAEEILESESLDLQIKFSQYFNCLLNDISYFNCKKLSEIWAFNRDELYRLFTLMAMLIKKTHQDPLKRPLKGVLMTCLSNYILKSRNNYNGEYICKYITPDVAQKSIINNELWLSKIEKLNDNREQKVISELFSNDEWNLYKWAKNIDFNPTRKYYVSSFSRAINCSDMAKKYGSCIYGYKNDKVSELIAPIMIGKSQDKIIPMLSQVISFDVLYDKEEAIQELIFLCKVIDSFEIPDCDKKEFLQEILQYWILSVKDPKWAIEKERRYVIFLYEGCDYKEIDYNNEILKIKSSLLLTPDFILGENPVKSDLQSKIDKKRHSRNIKPYLYCHDCLNIDFDGLIENSHLKKCKICGSSNTSLETPQNKSIKMFLPYIQK